MPELTLYLTPWCPFCVKVKNYLKGRGIEVAEKDTSSDRQAKDELISLTGRTQVPCLVIDGKPLLESNDIIQWFEDNVE